jgi:hypothetical protein
LFVPKQQRKQQWYTVGGKISDKTREQQINTNFWVKIGKRASETLAILAMAYNEYTVNKLSVFK